MEIQNNKAKQTKAYLRWDDSDSDSVEHINIRLIHFLLWTFSCFPIQMVVWFYLSFLFNQQTLKYN